MNENTEAQTNISPECSQKEFCAVLDIPQSTLSAYETDRMQPTVSTLINIATKFNVSLDWLCGIDKTNGGKYIDSKSIGLRIRTLRLERNLTQTDFAKLISKSLRTVQKYENRSGTGRNKAQSPEQKQWRGSRNILRSLPKA